MPTAQQDFSVHTKTHWLTRGVFGIALGSLFADWGYEAASAMLPLLAASLGAPAYALGLIEGVADGLSSFAKLGGGWIADHPALRKPTVVGGQILLAFATFAFGFVGAWPQLLAARAVAWIGRGVRGPARDTLLSNAVAPSQVGRAFGFERAMDTTGAILGPLCAAAFAAMISVSHAMRWTLLPGGLAALTFAMLAPSSARQGEHRALPFFASVAQLPREFQRYLQAVALFGFGDFAVTLLILRAIQLLTPAHGAVRAGAIGVALYTFHNLIAALACFPAGALGDRSGHRGILAIGYLLAGMTFVGFIFAPARIAPLAALFGLAGVYVAIQDTVEKSVATELLPREIRATGYGVLASVNGVGDFASSMIVGFLWSAVSPAAGFIYAATLTGAGGALLAATGRNRES
jgi:MFS family permease